MRSRWKIASFLASGSLAAWVARRYWEAGEAFEIVWLVPILALIWFHEAWADWVTDWFITVADTQHSPPWIVALAGWLLLLGLAILAES